MSRPVDSISRWTRTVGPLLLAALVLATVGSIGCKKQTSASRAARAFLAPEWVSDEASTLAFCGVGSSTGDETARGVAERLVEAELRGNQQRFVILSLKNTDSRAEAAGQSDLLRRVRQVWRDDRLVDQFLAQDLCKTLGVDGLIFGDLGDWTESRIDVTQEGTSWSRVELGLYIYAAETGLLVWGAERALREDSIPYRPSAVVGEGAVRTEREERRSERASAVTPDPPDVDEVAHAVMSELVGLFPVRN